ncbi:MAG TPA: aldehyde dehydrogenase family protein, partial [Candidatus Bathyarchaeia archaeon]|nr:aldehyde dehydrogenase family protein [Candidatus Bathyarchaeia archaeon]
LIQENKEELAKTITIEEGKALNEARAEVKQAYNTAMYFAGEGRRMLSNVTPSETKDKLTMTIRRPLGVAAIITPWNFPIMIPFWNLSPALVCGNTVVFKPASFTPITASRIVELFVKAGLPKGVLNVITGPGARVGKVLVESDKIRVCAFTGESQTGKDIAQTSMKYLRKQVLELGGKNPLIVASDADLAIAVGGALWSAFSNAGQKCTAASRIIVEESILDSFTNKFVEATRRLHVGNGLDSSTEIGPLISEGALAKTQEYVAIGIKEGAKLLAGGEDYKDAKDLREDLQKGNFHPPTVFSGTNDMKISQDEIFGPITTIIPVRNISEAIETANDTRYGLASAIYTKDFRNVMRAAYEIDAGVTFLNQGPVGIEVGASFGGVKDSGFGRELGEVGIEDYTEKKTLYLDYSNQVQPFFYPWKR